MKRYRIIVWSLVLTIFLLVAIWMSLWFGAREVAFGDILNALLGKSSDSLDARVVMARIPRTVFGIIAGAALAVSGAVMQSVTRNPIADPGILGVNTGASLAVVVGLVYLDITTAEQYIWLALIGAGLTAVIVYGIASLGNAGPTPLRLALSGATVSTALGSMISTVMMPDADAMNSYRFWQVGSIGASDWEQLIILLPFFVIGLLMGIVLSPYMNMLSMGDEMATSLGVNVKLIRLLACISGIILCGATTALAGPIGFIGLMIPHILRMLLGADMRAVIPLSVLGGGGLLLIADVIGRILGRPGEIEVGVVTAIIGAPVFIAIIRRTKVRSL